VKLGKQSSKEQAHFSRNDLDKFQQFFSKMSGRGGTKEVPHDRST
jgi:hypothetical protein